jgi:signal transduction histidine kinase
MQIFNIEKKIMYGYFIAFFLLLFSYVLIIYTTEKITEKTKWVTHTHIVQTALEELMSNIKDAETGYRGYIIMGEEKYLNPFYYCQQEIKAGLSKIRVYTSDNALQQSRCDTLDSLIKRRMNVITQGIFQFKNSDYQITDSLRQQTIQSGSDIMFYIRSTVNAMVKTEDKTMQDRNTELANFSNAIKFINITSLVVAILLSFYSIGTFHLEYNAKKEADMKAAEYRIELEMKVAELKSANEELSSLKSLEKFTSTGRIARTLAHEVRNPLTNINLAAAQLEETFELDEESRFLFDIIRRNSERINNMVSSLLNATKFTELHVEHVNIHSIIDDTIRQAADRIALKNVALQTQYASEDIMVWIDVAKIKIALMNIIVNAIEAMEDGAGTLKISTIRQDNNCLIRITDNGTGMTEDTLNKLFEPYFTNKVKGNGLGLTNTQTILLNHKGSIKAESKLGAGTTFTLCLPLEKPEQIFT